jgi:carbon storage regulator
MMLVLTRKPTERIVIGDCITVEVLEVRGNKVRLGVTAPKSLPVHRLEVQIGIDSYEPRPLVSPIEQSRALLTRSLEGIRNIMREVSGTALADRLHAIAGDMGIARMLMPDALEATEPERATA